MNKSQAPLGEVVICMVGMSRSPPTPVGTDRIHLLGLHSLGVFCCQTIWLETGNRKVPEEQGPNLSLIFCFQEYLAQGQAQN